MRDVAIVSVARAEHVRRERSRNEVEILMPVVHEVLEDCGIPKEEIGFTCSGTCDFLAGQPFSFVSALDAVGAWPPIIESHVEMDGAWALYEAWVRLQHGDLDSALVYAVGKSSMGDLKDVLCMQLDPYVLAPLWPDPISLAALQARAYLEKTGKTEADLAEVAARNGKADLDAPYIVSPLRRHDCPPIADGAAAVVLAAGDLAEKVCSRPAWIRGIDHRIEQHSLGARDLTTSPSTALAAQKANVGAAKVDVAELHAPFTHQELILREALALNGETRINPSGGALAGNPVMVAGLERFVAAAQSIHRKEADRAVAHATSGPCLQQNLVAVLEA
ncbi:MAG TPA: thiolase domain-containing protein [Actinomycetota bacterium]|nr:thiolase domain-containing protein [Actinomycetota bacterium]